MKIPPWHSHPAARIQPHPAPTLNYSALLDKVEQANEDLAALIRRLENAPPPKKSESLVVKLAPEKERWLVSQSDWIKNDDRHRSNAHSDTGLNG